LRLDEDMVTKKNLAFVHDQMLYLQDVRAYRFFTVFKNPLDHIEIFETCVRSEKRSRKKKGVLSSKISG